MNNQVGTGEPIVSVCPITYNHAKYISQAIEGVLSQKINFEFEIIIGEDESSDGTREIALDYQRKYPGKIKVLLHSRKDVIYINGRATGRWNFIDTLSHARGKYIALLPCDDYWTDPNKLQKQVDFLEKHPECSISFHNCEEIYEDGIKESWLYCPPDQKELSTLEDLLTGCNFIPSCSVVFRNGLFGEFPEWYYSCAMGDWPLHILNAQHGSIAYIKETMGKHRNHKGSVWYSRDQAQNIRDVIKTYKTINRHFNYKYNYLIKAKISDYYHDMFALYLKSGEKGQALKNLCASFINAPLPKNISKRYILSFFKLFFR